MVQVQLLAGIISLRRVLEANPVAETAALTRYRYATQPTSYFPALLTDAPFISPPPVLISDHTFHLPCTDIRHILSNSPALISDPPLPTLLHLLLPCTAIRPIPSYFPALISDPTPSYFPALISAHTTKASSVALALLTWYGTDADRFRTAVI